MLQTARTLKALVRLQAYPAMYSSKSVRRVYFLASHVAVPQADARMALFSLLRSCAQSNVSCGGSAFTLGWSERAWYCSSSIGHMNGVLELAVGGADELATGEENVFLRGISPSPSSD